MKLSRLHALAALTLTFTVVSARAETPAAPAPAPAPAPTPPPAAPAAAAAQIEARREDIEPKTLTESLTLLKTARADRDRAEKDHAAEVAAHTKNRELLKSTLEIATKAKADLETATTALTAMTQERDREKAAHDKTKETLTLAESALGVHGVTSANAVTAPSEEVAGTHIYDRWLAATGAEKSKLWAEHRVAIRTEGERRAKGLN